MKIYELITGKKYPVEDVYIGDVETASINAGGTILDSYPVEKRALFLKTEEGYTLIAHGVNVSGMAFHCTELGDTFPENINDGKFRGSRFIINQVPFLTSYVTAELPEKATVRQLKKSAKNAPVVYYA